MIPTHRIALLLDRGLGVTHGLVQGIRAYAADKPDWVLRDCPPRLDMVPHVLEWKPHGIIVCLVLARMARNLLRKRIPLVDTACVLSGQSFPTVDVDHAAVGRMAADYYLERKFVHFGFFGSESALYSKVQESAFRQRIAGAGYEVSSCYGEFLSDLTVPRLWKQSTQDTRRWLRRLARPAAVFCCDDAPARYLIDVCGQIGLNVPEDIAVLGVGNDELECQLAQPSLSSVAAPMQRIGYETAALLDRQMSGASSTPSSLFLPPSHIITRRSTDIMAVEDPLVREAVQYISRHAREELSIADLVRALSVGRRPLERRFRQVLGRSVLEEIHRLRIQRAKELLLDTELPVATVAARAGFSSIRRLDVLFRQHLGLSPTAYRQQSRQPAAAKRS